MNYSIIIPSYIRPVELERCINTLIDILNDNLRLVVILDGSPKFIFDMVRSFKSKYIHLIEGDGNLFWGGAINLGMAYSFEHLAAERVIWLNDDTFFTADNVISFINTTYEKHAIVGARLIGRNVNKNIYGVEEYSNLVPVKFLNGNFTSIPREVYNHFGNIDNNKFPHFADAPYLEKIVKDNRFKLFVNSNVSVDIHYDVLRHLSAYEQFAIRDKKIEFIRWSFFDIRSKWYFIYRKNYYLNKFGVAGYLFFLVAFFRDWARVIFTCPYIFFCEKTIKTKVIKSLKYRLPEQEFNSLLDEIK
ncbi:glycosyltransferase family 2 protein [Aeromonas sp. FDAARGOS 1407]|uniref:glycosyltransferase family 2 protein n=1 Tax=Aeromonas TaxID=642 RepID=UPI001C229C38|nr:glycosyltransferase [Aeromonas sp. FDAARGOS 1407]QXC33761.1 glycosyltransferase [Aeromonas sp. FDAARGOS 1407]